MFRDSAMEESQECKIHICFFFLWVLLSYIMLAFLPSSFEI